MSSHDHESEHAPASATGTATEARGPNTGGVEITDKAAEQIAAIRDREKLGTHVLRVSVVGGGCSGMSYRMGFVEAAGENDRIIEKNGVQVAIDPKSFLYLKGTVIDYADGLNGKGFTFGNPNAKRSCGCGSSFSS